MDKLKDKFYNINDIIVALLILAVAITIIYFRVTAIMDYPKTFEAEADAAPKALIEEAEEIE